MWRDFQDRHDLDYIVLYSDFIMNYLLLMVQKSSFFFRKNNNTGV